MSEPDRVLSRLGALKRGLDSPGPALPLSPAREQAMLDAALGAAVVPLARTRAWRLVPAVAMLALSAAAALSWLGSSASSNAPTEPQAGMLAGASGPAPSSALPVDPAPVVKPEAPQQAEPEKRPDAPAPSVGARSSSSAESSEAAKEVDLLKQANDLRRSGDAPGAEKLYRQVMQKYPQTTSAYVAMSSVASLIMNRDPAGAADVYRAARHAHPSGALDLEIRQGLARAYRKLGQAAAERQELQDLITHYPRSEASERAKLRLLEL